MKVTLEYQFMGMDMETAVDFKDELELHATKIIKEAALECDYVKCEVEAPSDYYANGGPTKCGTIGKAKA